MLTYFLKRLGIVIPTLFLVTVIAFLLSRLTPGDPIARFCGDPEMSERAGFLNPEESDRQYAACARQLGRDRPTFYVSLLPLAFPDTLYRELRVYRRAALRRLIREFGNWPAIQAYATALSVAEHSLPDYRGVPAVQNAVTDIRVRLRQLRVTGKPERAERLIDEVNGLSGRLAETADSIAHAIDFGKFQNDMARLTRAFGEVQETPTRWRLLIPTLRWHGFENQYHHWLIGVIRGDLGVSYQDRQPVMKKITSSARWTLLINGLAIILAFTIAIPLGGWSASAQGSRRDHVVSLLLFGLYSLPAFWVATLLILFLTTPEYGAWLDWFPTGGLGMGSPSGFFAGLADLLWHLTLPVICLTYGSLAVIARQMRGSMADALQRPFIVTARSKGLDERAVVWRHGLRNALFPIITMLGSVVPALLAGSVIIEYIFSIPGMGQLTYQSIVAEDWPVVFGILLIAALLTMVGNMVADILYMVFDPRVTFKGERG